MRFPVILPEKKVDEDLGGWHEIEKKFHDEWAKTIKEEDVNYTKAFTAETASENRYALSNFGNLVQARILDLGCGMGDASLYFATKKARVHAVDISPEMIKLVRRLATKKGYAKKLKAEVMVAEQLKFPSRYFDYVFGNGILHHVQVDVALKEVCGVLKPNGIAVFIEPLGHNPVINIYRKIANKVRTVTETPLNYSQLDRLTTAKYKSHYHKEFHLFTLLIFLWFYFVESADPNKERYWKKIINDADRIKGPYRIFEVFDNFLFKAFPYLRKFSWNTVLVYKK